MVGQFNAIRSCDVDPYGEGCRMVSYSISMPNRLKFVTELDESQVFMDAWLKNVVIESVTLDYRVKCTDEGPVSFITSKFQTVRIENVEAGVNLEAGVAFSLPISKTEDGMKLG